MNASRRDVILGTLFGAGHVGLRALATGLPAAAFLRPVRAFGADCGDPSRAQYLILSTSSQGDPLNANVPGTYDYPDIPHAADPRMEGVDLRLGAVTTRAARVWSTLPQPVLDRTCFFHHATLTNNHPNLPKVMRLMGATYKQEMLPSLIAKHLAPCLGTIQTEPVSVGAGEILTFDGRGLPNLNPTGLRDVLSQPQGPLKDLQKLRDASLDRMYAALRTSGTKPQLDYLDRLARSRAQARSIAEDLLSMLSSIQSDRSDGQVVAAAALIKMRVSPVVAIHIEFGGDNHTDEDLMRFEVPQTEIGIQRIGALMDTLQQYGLTDQVTFAMYNVFGRTLKKLGLAGRDHWASHHTTVMIGKPVRPGVVGGLEPQAGDYYATPIDAKTGRAAPGAGDIPFGETLAAMGKTLAFIAGVDRASIDQEISQGKVVDGAVA
jgi:hypothetical protein